MKTGAEAHQHTLRGARLLDRIDYRVVETPEDKDIIYLMRYRAYLHSGLISPSESKRVTDRYDDAPNTTIVAVYVDGELCGSIRLHVLTAASRMSYTAELFGDVLDSRLDRGEVFVDTARFVADPLIAPRFPELPYLTVRLPFMASEYFNADTSLAMIRSDHMPFYRRVFLNKQIAEPRPFPGWHTMTVSLTACDFKVDRDVIATRFPIMRSSAFERRMLFERPAKRAFAPSAVVTPFERPAIVPAA